jgi:hypothetical protein
MHCCKYGWNELAGEIDTFAAQLREDAGWRLVVAYGLRDPYYICAHMVKK